MDLLQDLEARLWVPATPQAPVWRRAGRRALQLVYVILRDLAEGQLSLRAMSLVYTSLLSLVPLLAVSFSVLKAFEVHNQIEPILRQWLAPLGPQGQEISSRIIEFVANMKVGVLGAVGVGLLFYTVLSLLQKVERAFNDTWHVRQDRSFAQRFTHYLSVLIIGPVLVFSALGLTASLMNSAAVQAMSGWPVLGTLIAAIPRLLPYLLIIAAFSFIYRFVPNTRVRAMPALAGAAVGGVLWQSAGWLFAAFLADAGSYTAIYSAFATLILFLLWLYLSWLTLLIGASLSFYLQNPAFVRQTQTGLSHREREELGLELLRRVGQAYYAREPAPALHELAGRLNRTSLELAEAVERLATEHFLAATQDDPPRYLPGRPYDTAAVHDALRCLRGRPAEGNNPSARLLADLDQAEARHLAGLSLKDWLHQEDRSP